MINFCLPFTKYLKRVEPHPKTFAHNKQRLGMIHNMRRARSQHYSSVQVLFALVFFYRGELVR